MKTPYCASLNKGYVRVTGTGTTQTVRFTLLAPDKDRIYWVGALAHHSNGDTSESNPKFPVEDVVVTTRIGISLKTGLLTDIQLLEGARFDLILERSGDVSGISTVDVVLDFDTLDGSADESDVRTTPSRVVFGPGKTEATYSIYAWDDGIHEVTERFAFRLANPVNAALSRTDPIGIRILNDHDSAPMPVRDPVPPNGGGLHLPAVANGYLETALDPQGPWLFLGGGLAEIVLPLNPGEDHRFFRIIESGPVVPEAVPYDYGDAPASYGTIGVTAAAHQLVPGVHLGTRIDAEPTGQPTANADGDDKDAAGNDDDGVVFATPLVPGSLAFIEVTASTDGFLDAWIDYNQDGAFRGYGLGSAPNERIVDAIPFHTGWSYPLKAGKNTVGFNVPESARAGPTFARFRFTTKGYPSPIFAAPDGEVEDYAVTIAARP
jgi:hypothetical protein